MTINLIKQLYRYVACLPLVALLFTSCVTKEESAGKKLPGQRSFGKKKHHSETCEDPSFEVVKLSGHISASLLQPPSGLYRLGPGDELDIEIAEDVDTQATVRVMPDGLLYYNVADGINVNGKSIREVSKALSDSLSYDYVEPIVTVNISNPDSQRYWVMGEVREPGAFPLRKPTTLIAALSQTAGLGSESAVVGDESEETVDLARASLVRNGKMIPVDFKALVEDGDMSQNVYIRNNDYIFLPSRVTSSIYVLGEVNSPGPVFFDGDNNLLTAIAAAGGPTDDAVVSKAMIIRGSTVEPHVSIVNLPNLMRGQTANKRLRSGDIVWLPRTFHDNLRTYTETVLTTAAQAIAVQEGLAAFGTTGGTGVTISAGN